MDHCFALRVKFSADAILKYVSCFSQETGFDFHTNCLQWGIVGFLSANRKSRLLEADLFEIILDLVSFLTIKLDRGRRNHASGVWCISIFLTKLDLPR